MREFSWMLLVLLAFSVYAEDEKVVVVGSAKELKGITAKKVIWKKDGAKMVRIPAGSFEMGDHFNEGSDRERPLHTVELDEFYMDSRIAPLLSLVYGNRGDRPTDPTQIMP